ncbi:MAG: YHS domain-containing (seleno)protein [Pseudomonadota bacterium]
MKKALITGLMITGFLSSAAFAGPQYVDETGYAVSGYDVVAYHSLKQAAVGQKQPPAVPGKTAHVVEYNGAKWAFSTAENAETFKANPAKYAPLYDGHCAYGLSQGGKVPANPNLWRIVDGKLYLNITPAVVGFWEKDIPGLIKAANKNWSKKEDAAASKKRWTSINANKGTYTSAAPLTN